MYARLPPTGTPGGVMAVEVVVQREHGEKLAGLGADVKRGAANDPGSGQHGFGVTSVFRFFLLAVLGVRI